MSRAHAACRRHRAALTAFAADRQALAGTRPALEHLDRCPACAREVEELLLTVFALKRAGVLPTTVPSSTPWPRLRDRIEQTRANAALLAWRWRTTVAGVAASALVVAAVVAPAALHLPLGTTGAEPAGYSPTELDRISRQIEHRYIFDARPGNASPVGATVPSPANASRTARSQGTSLMRFPDGITRPVKEVGQRPTGRPPIVD